MGKTYLFECPRCGYKAKVSGRPDDGARFEVQTISCRTCKKLYDVVTRHKAPAPAALKESLGGNTVVARKSSRSSESPPLFETVFNQMPIPGQRLRWVQFKIRCPVSADHKVQAWKDPGRCPCCSVFMEKSPLPFRFWE